MITLKDVADLVSSFGITASANIYCGKMPSKPDFAIGVYNNRNKTNDASIPIGGISYKSYDTKEVSILLHWNKNPIETETAANILYNRLIGVIDYTINNKKIQYISADKPLDVGTDESNTYEMVVNATIYYER